MLQIRRFILRRKNAVDSLNGCGVLCDEQLFSDETSPAMRYLTPMLEDGFIEREKGVDKCSSQVRYMITSKGRKVVL